MSTRRQFLLQGAAASLLFTRTGWAAATDAVEVSTPLGRLRGERMASGVRAFRGVPFAQPPVGDARFRAALPMKPWSGVRDATRFGAASLQPYDRGIAQSEDCLYLNVWAPETKQPAPVFVWVHGGGFTGGNSFAPIWEGEQFAQAGIVCITVAYRLGALGFLDVSSLLGKEYEGSANHGLGDVVAALEWVQQNIAAFGGDPTRVTLGGESAGAKLTDLLLGSDAPASLFSQAISESGGADRTWTSADAATFAQAYGKLWTDKTGTPVTAMKTADARQLIDVQDSIEKSYPRHFPFRSELAAPLFKRWPLQAMRAGTSAGPKKQRRLLLGTNRDESALFLGPHPEKPITSANLGNVPLDVFKPIEQRYAELYPDMPADLRRIRSVTAEEYWIPSLRVADAHVQAGGTAFVYRFDFPASGHFAGETPHASDLGYVWNHLGGAKEGNEAARAMAVQMHAAWASFILGHEPAAPGLPAWPRYNLQTRPTMLLNAESRVENAPLAPEFALWNGLLEQR
ncbi:carboxylesterase/lipase family protein [Granulicella cerasi]|uniref:Carboxylic ester hydrolase n=1 Tax=Granulicella cerasi TaxID=741063 RepID=A0ABW1Z9G8_9BACT|nr:carboxylesterase family protein [Granulicella cerasi]